MLKLIYSSSIAAIASVFFVTGVTIWAELSPALKEGLLGVSGHHWVTKSIFVMVIYFLVLFCVYTWTHSPAKEKVRGALHGLVVSVIVGFILILGFYIWHFLK